MEQHSLDDLDTFVFQFVVKNRQLSQKKNEIQQQIKVYRTCITEKRSHIETIQQYIKNLEEEIRVKQNTLMKNKEKAKSMKATNSLLLQYEQTLKAELESQTNSYNHDQELYEERIESCTRTLQSHKETCFQNPAAQMLLLLQAEIEEIESRIKDCDDCMTMKQKELAHLAGTAMASYSVEKLQDSVLDQELATEQSEQKHEDCPIDISSIDLNQAASGHEPAVEAGTKEMNEDNKVLHQTSHFDHSEEPNNELRFLRQMDEPGPPEETHSEPEDQDISKEQQVPLPALPGPEEVPKNDQQEEAPDAEDHQEPIPTKQTPVSPTPAFAFNFSPASSPLHSSSDSKSFVLNLDSNVSTPGFSGFGFDMSSSQQEDSSFAFSGSFFNEKKTPDAKSSSCTKFLFDQPEQSEDFPFPFTTKSPQSDKANSKDEFPFSFNF